MSSDSHSAIPIIFLKTASTPSDPYETHFSARPPYEPVFVPVLSHKHTNLDALGAAITSGLSGYSDLIITSQRAVEAFGAVIGKLKSENVNLAPVFSRRVYVVGPATSAAVTALGFAASHVLGSDCGNGAALAEFIVQHHSRSSAHILFLVGETRRDVIPTRLREAGIAMEELVVYETSVVDDFREQFAKAVAKTKGARRRWVVVFSPQGAEVAVDVLKKYADADGVEGGDSGNGAREEGGSGIAAIGPTTEAFLREKVGRAPDVVARKPSPVGLWEAIESLAESARTAGGVL